MREKLRHKYLYDLFRLQLLVRAERNREDVLLPIGPTAIVS